MESPPVRKRQRLGSGPLKLDTFANAKSSKYNIKELRRKHEFIQNAQKVRKFRKQLQKGNTPGLKGRADQQSQASNHAEPDAGDEGDANLGTAEQEKAETSNRASGNKETKTAGIKERRKLSSEKLGGVESPELEDENAQHLDRNSRESGDKGRTKGSKRKRPLSQVERLKREADAKRAAQEAERLERQREFESRRKAKEAAERARKQTVAKMHKKTRRGQPVMKHRVEHLLEKLQKGEA